MVIGSGHSADSLSMWASGFCQSRRGLGNNRINIIVSEDLNILI